MSIRLRIFLLVLLASLPALGFLALHVFSHRADEIEEAKQNLAVLAGYAAQDLDEALRGAVQLTAGLSRTQELRQPEPAACSAFLAGMLKEFPQYTTLATYALDGEMQCDGLQSGKRVNIADRAYFPRLLAANGALVTEPVFGRITGTGVIPVFHPIFGADGRAQSYLLAAVNLARFADKFAAARHAHEAVFVLWDRHGNIMARHPDNARWAGKAYLESPVTRFVLDQRAGGTVEATGADGVQRIWAIAGLPQTRDTGLRLGIGYTQTALFAAADRGFTQTLWTLGGISLLLLVAAWLLGEAAIGRPAARIMAAMARFRGGELGARIGAPYPGGELGELMQALDATAAEIEAQQQKIRDLNATLEQRVAERTAQVEEKSAEIMRKNAQLEQASRMKSEFLANMSHELRTPLNAILGFSELLRDGLMGTLPGEQKTAVADIHNAGRHLLALINDVLDLSKIEAGKMSLEPEEIDVRELLDGALFIVREKAMAHRINLTLDAAAGLGAIAADVRKAKQILYNLLSNAVKFTPDGGSVTLAARRVAPAEVAHADAWGRCLPPAAAAAWLEVTVTDTGPGMSAEDLQRLFQPFVQLDSGLTKRFEGTGLGLAMVRRLAELHGGAVAVKSQVGAGSTFAVWLPMNEMPAAAAPPPAAGKDEGGGARGRSGERPLALVIEDDAAATDFIRRVLEAEGLEVGAVDTVAAANVWLAGRKPDLVTLDILLPGTDGWSFLETMKQSPHLRDVPVIVVSIVADQARGFALGASCVLQKPVGRAELMAALAKVGIGGDGRRDRVLIVDDDPRAVDILAAYLPAAGYEVLCAHGGREAIDLVRGMRPDLILLDLLMPEVSGFDVVDALHADPQTATIPIIVVTAKLLDAADRAALDGRVRGIVEKAGIDGSVLGREVRRALAGRGAPASREAT
jgi:signal transduction histidine kinase/CheY-like chemotaxis protein